MLPTATFRRTFRGALGRAVAALSLCAAAAVLALAAADSAQAAPVPNAQRQVSITAREQPVAAFLHDLFAAVDVPATIAPGVAGSVNGTFTGPAERVLRDIARVYNLIPYFDGTVMHVVPASELVRRTYTVAPAVADRMLREAGDLGLPDARNTLRRSGEGSMLAVGTRRFVEQVDELAQATLDAPKAAAPNAGTVDFRVFYLRYGWAQDMTMTMGGRQIVIPGVASILRSLVGAQASAPLGQEIMLRPTRPSLKGQGLGGQGTAAKPPKGGGREAAADMLVAALARTALPADPAAAPTIAADPNQIRIEADPRLNAIIVRDLADRLPRYEQLIAALDVEPQSLEIEATIIDINTDRMRELGINWRWSNAGNEALFGNGTASDLLLRAGQTVTPLGRGGIISAVLGSAGQFVSRISALQAEGAARIVSSPQVVTLSNVEAVFDNSSTFFVRVAGKDEVDLFNVSAGTSLRVTPHVFRDKDATRIKLMVQVDDGTLTGQQVDKIPVVERSTINTQALIAEGESLLIGGMTRDSSSSNVDKVPGLGDLPVVGNLFKTRTNSSSRVERMFLITPRLAGSRPATGATAPAAASRAAPQPVAPDAPVQPLLQTRVEPASLPATPAPATGADALRVAATATAVQTSPPRAAAPVAYSPPARASVVLDLDAPLPAAAEPPRGASGTVPGAVRAPAAAPMQVGLTANTQR
jgi:type III secretion protein C